ncbi:MAG: hypothetical protein ACLGSD_00480 [Acidobacteriota bacterium]
MNVLILASVPAIPTPKDSLYSFVGCLLPFGIGFALGLSAALLIALLKTKRMGPRPTESDHDKRDNFIIKVVVAGLFSVAVAVSVVIYKNFLDGAGDEHSVRTSLAAFGFTFLIEIAAVAFGYWFSYTWPARQIREEALERQLKEFVVDPLRTHFPYTGIKEHYPWNESLHWGTIIRNAKKIDICVQGWDSFFKSKTESWKEFFRNNGTLNLIVPELEISEAREQTIFHMSDRMKRRNESVQIAEIENTIKVVEDFIKDVRESSSTVGQVYVRRAKPMLWYCLIRVDDEVAYLSVYEQCRGVGIGSPIYEIDLSRCQYTRKWINKEFSALLEIPPLIDPSNDRKKSKRHEEVR